MWGSPAPSVGVTRSKQDQVRDQVSHQLPERFQIRDPGAAVPGAGGATIRLVLDRLRREGRIWRESTGRSAAWRRCD